MRDPRGARPVYDSPEIDALRIGARPYWRGDRSPAAREAHRRYSLAVANAREGRAWEWSDDLGLCADEIRMART